MFPILEPNNTDLQEGRTYSLHLSSDRFLPVRWSRAPLREALDVILIDRPNRLDILNRLKEYPHLFALLDEHCLSYAKQRKAQVREWLSQGVYIFGAYKIGVKIARHALLSGCSLKGFIDNDQAKDGHFVEGISISHPSVLDLNGEVVIVASGRHGNAIQQQLREIADVRIVNMHEFLYALEAPQGPESDFTSFVHSPHQEAFRFISAFLRLDDERSRQVFDGLIGMRTGLSINLADDIKSPFDEEYFDCSFVSSEQAARFVDAGAFTGDTLRRLEQRFGPVKQAYLFEPELPAYYEALKSFSERQNVWLFNMGLDESPSRAVYQPTLSCDMTHEIEGPVAPGTTSYIQGVPLDEVLRGMVGLFKLDIEGMEARALRGARATIVRDRPVLAVCAYHRADDYWRLIDEVQAIRPDYRIAIRLYADILEDITLYFY